MTPTTSMPGGRYRPACGPRRWPGVVVAGLGMAAVTAAAAVSAASGAEPADVWLTNGAPVSVVASAGSTAEYESLGAALANQYLRVAWDAPASISTNAQVVVETSVGKPGHWASRDFALVPMKGTGGSWSATLPVPSVEHPLIYRVRVAAAGVTNASPWRLFQPLSAGLELPTFPFSGYLEGFEDGAPATWQPTVSGVPEGGVTVGTNALSGRWALRLTVPPSRGSITVGTTRIQPWMLLEHSPVAVRFAARTEGGGGRIGCALHGNARTEDLAVYPAAGTFDVGPDWRRFEVPMEAFLGLRPSTVDWFTIQFFAEPGRVLDVDDVELVLR